MWEPSAREGDAAAMGKEGKEQVDSQLDSGFLSGSNLMSSEMSIEPEDDRTDEPIEAPESPKPLVDLGVDSAFCDLSLKENTAAPLDSGIIEDSEEDFGSAQVKEQSLQPYELCYTQDNDGDTQLHICVLLVMAGADPLIRDFKGNTPLHVACLTKDINCAKAITNFGKRLPQLSQNMEQKNYVDEVSISGKASKFLPEPYVQLLNV
ncbi:hypothetical protein QAD02_004586 [Eretmocerus hayati]|uniref:Uncharacterized protein n=1 Tax=Eretmocerus hayati TaxID=131215 RepID=A0ACC2NSP3_9HYME|nr:hypothetical protein QAD02_004586 [Eretmocerus hayati]